MSLRISVLALSFFIEEHVKNISQCTNNIFIPLLCSVPSCLISYLSCLIKCFLLWFKILRGIFSSDFNLGDSDRAGGLRFVFLPFVFWYQHCLKCGFQSLPLDELPVQCNKVLSNLCWNFGHPWMHTPPSGLRFAGTEHVTERGKGFFIFPPLRDPEPPHGM